MNKRGIIIGLIGIILSIISFSIMFSFFPLSETFGGNFILPNLLEDMFDDISPETEILPGQTALFSFSGTKSQIPLLWGVQIIDFLENDRVTIKISNFFGDSFGIFEQKGPIIFDMFVMPNSEVYTFEVSNQGTRPILVVMMFAEDPDNSESFSNPNSPLMTTLVPLALSGIILVLGIIVTIAGAIVATFDWKKERDESDIFKR